MSTRSIVTVALPGSSSIFHFYRHHDGMPWFAGADLAVMLQRSGSCVTGFLEELTGAVYADRDRNRMVYDEVGPRDAWMDIEGTDCDWHYEVRFHAGAMVNMGLVPAVTVRVLRRGAESVAFSGNLSGFLQFADRHIHCVNVSHDAGLARVLDDRGAVVRERASFEAAPESVEGGC